MNRVVAFITCLFVYLIAAALLFGAVLPAPPDPLAAYRAYLPGEPESNTLGLDCTRWLDSTYPYSNFYCLLFPANDGAVRWFSISGRQEVITRTVFGVRRLRVGDLMRIEGVPFEAYRVGRRRYWNWQGVVGYAPAARGLTARLVQVVFTLYETPEMR